MSHGLSGGACFNAKLSHDGLQAPGLVGRNVFQDVLVASLLGDSTESRLHLSRGTPAVNISPGRLAVNTQQSQRTFAERVIGGNGIHLDIVFQQEGDVLVKGLYFRRR